MAAHVIHYFDYKSPYAYLAQAPTKALAADATVEWRPYTLDIPAYLGSAEVGPDGKVLSESRNAHQWRRVKYAYMDCRREARRVGLTVRGPRKIFDSTIAHVGFLYAADHGDPMPYHDAVFERFWRRELDIEDPAVVAAVLAECGVDAGGFPAWLDGAGRAALEAIQTDAEARGVFGVPSYLVGEELFWGLERLERVIELVGA
ncbi:MAG: DsbA family protein [Gammaproteobacteria bacterium]